MRKQVEVPEDARLPDEIWERIQVWVPPQKKPGSKGGRPRNDDRKMMDAIYYVLRTGCQWKLLPRSIAAGSSAHDRFQEWREQGVMDKIWAAGLFEYDARKGIDWEWQSIDGAMTKAPLGGEATGANPTDRGKSGTKRSILTDGRGVPLGISVAGANRPDMELVKATLDSIAVERPEVTHDRKQHFLGDKGYDYQMVIELVEAREYIEHICRRGTDAHASISLSTSDTSKIPGYRARRWVVERTHSWMNRFRRILIRWEKKVENYVALLKLAGAYIAFRAAGVVA